MASRWCRLALVAYSRGILDFESSAEYDWRWFLKEKLILDAVEDDLVADMNRLSHQWHCSAAQITGWDEHEELFNYHKDRVKKAYNLIGKSRLPWYKWVTGPSLKELWKRFKDEEKDPKYASHLAKLRKELRDRVSDIQDESDSIKDSSERRRALLKKQADLIRRMKANV